MWLMYPSVEGGNRLTLHIRDKQNQGKMKLVWNHVKCHGHDGSDIGINLTGEMTISLALVSLVVI